MTDSVANGNKLGGATYVAKISFPSSVLIAPNMQIQTLKSISVVCVLQLLAYFILQESADQTSQLEMTVGLVINGFGVCLRETLNTETYLVMVDTVVYGPSSTVHEWVDDYVLLQKISHEYFSFMFLFITFHSRKETKYQSS